MVVFRQVSFFDSQRHRHWQGHRAGLPNRSTVGKSIAVSPAQGIRTSACGARVQLTWWQNVLSTSAGNQSSSWKKVVERFPSSANSFEHQPFGIGFHQWPHVAGDRFVATAVTKIMVARVGAADRSEQSILRAADFAMRQHDGDAARADRQRSNRRLQLVSAERSIFIELGDRGFNQLPTSFGADDQAGTNLPELDHVGHLHDPVENPQARVRHVVDQAPLR